MSEASSSRLISWCHIGMADPFKRLFPLELAYLFLSVEPIFLPLPFSRINRSFRSTLQRKCMSSVGAAIAQTAGN